MNEAAQQLLHEKRYREAKLQFAMKTETITPNSPSSAGSDATSTSITHNFDSLQSQRSDGGQISALHASLLSGKFSDLTVIHGEQKWNAHKVVVCAQSSVLESMIKTVGASSIIDLTESPHDAVDRLMQYLYTNSYTTQDIAPDFALHSHVGVFSLATSLEIPALQAFAEERFRYALNNHIAEIPVYFTNVRRIYSTTTYKHPGLRNAVTEAAVTEMKTLLNVQYVRKQFLEILTDTPEFHTDILRFLAHNPERPVQVVLPHLCEDCGPMSEGKSYVLQMECRDCGKTKPFQFH